MGLLDGADAVLFDLDDTLLDYSAARDAGILTWVQEVEAARHATDVVRRWRELEEHHFRRYSQGEVTFQEQRRARMRAFRDDLGEAPDEVLDRAFVEYIAHTEAAWAPVPGAVETVRAVAARVQVAVLTNGPVELQARKLATLGLGDLALFASSELPAPKPDVRAYEAACTELGVLPARTVMVGDDLTNDVEGALYAGLRSVWFCRIGGRETWPVAPSRAVSVVTDLRELLS